MIVERELIKEAKEKLGDKNAFIMADLLDLQNFDEKNLKALCPYHDEKTPSFVYNRKGYYFKCFGCSKTVDIIDVLMEKGYTFLDAVSFLFEKAGIEYSFGEQYIKTRRDYRYPHEEPLGEKEQVIEYFGKRGISKNVLDYLDVRQDAKGNAVFNFYDENDVLTMVKYRPSHTVDKAAGQSKTWCQHGADTSPILFNMNRINTSNPLLITEGECYRGDAEVLTKNGWIRLDEYNDEEVLQVDSEYKGSFVKPIAKVKKHYSGDFYTYKSGENFELSTTPEHNWVYVDYKGLTTKRKICDFPTSLGNGFIKTTVEVDGVGIPFSDSWIALWLAISADGKIDIRKTDEYNYCRISFKKERKKDRFEKILNECNIEYYRSDKQSRDGYTFFGLRIPKIVTKELPNEWLYQASLRQRKFILEEMVNWDGNHVPNRNQVEYSSKLYHNATWMQTIAYTCGYMSTIIPRKNEYGEWYKVSILYGKNHVSYNNRYLSIDHYDGDVYCVTVPTGEILVRQNNKITVCGNCDTMSAIEAGYLNTVSVPLGAGNLHWIDENWDWLNQFDSIIVWADNDAPGEKMRKECIYRLGTWKTKYIVTPSEYVKPDDKRIPLKDINDCLQIGGKEFVMKLIADAKDVPIKSVVDYSQIEELDVSEMDGVKTGIKPVDDALLKIFYGTLTILSGRPGSGKTSIIDQMIARTIDEGKSVFLFSKEMPERMSANWFNTILAGRRNLEQRTSRDGKDYYVVTKETQKTMQDYYKEKLFIYRDDEPNDVKSVLESAEECVRKYGCKLVALDNLMMLDLKCDESNRNGAQTDLINTLIKFAAKFNVAVVLVAHPKKTQDNNSDIEMYDISGTSNIINLAMRAIGMRRVSKKEKEDPHAKWNKYDVVMTIVKDRLLGRADVKIGLWYDIVSRRFYTDYDEYDAQFEWDKGYYPEKLPYVDRLKVNPDDIFPDK